MSSKKRKGAPNTQSRQNQPKVQEKQTKKVEEEPIRPLITPFQKAWGSESLLRELAIIVLKEHFGDVVGKVAGEILLRKNQRIGQIASNLQTTIEECKKSMMVLLQHNCINYRENIMDSTGQRFITYEGNVPFILQRIRFPTFISIVKEKLGNDGEFLIEEFLANGKLTLSMATKQAADVSAKLIGSLASAEKEVERLSQVVSKMLQLHYLEKCDALEINISTVTNSNGTSETILENQNTYYRVNYTKLNILILSEHCINYAREKFGDQAAEILKIAFSITEVIMKEDDFVSRPFTVDQIVEYLKTANSEITLASTDIIQYLDGLSKGQNAFATKYSGESGYSLNVGAMFRAVKQRLVESIVHEKFGMESARIFRIIQAKKMIEQKQIQTIAKLAQNESRDRIYKLMLANYIQIQDVPRTQDHAPIRTIYLYTVKPEQLAFQMNTEMYKTIFNLKMRVMHHMKQSQELIMKAENAQARPNEIILSEQEIQSLQQIQHIEDMLESTILRTDESLLILQSIM